MFMSKFIIQGGNKLGGEVAIGGSKNEVLPALCACLLTAEPVAIKNVPRISDVDKLLVILRSLGAEADWSGEHEIRVCARNVNIGKLDSKLVAAFRGSVLLMGPLLARFGSVTLPEPGGDIIGKRPLDDHFMAFEKMKASVVHGSGTVSISGALHGSDDLLPVFSVTATENAIMAAALVPETTVIKLAAAEPHVQKLCRMLVSMGATIDGIGTHTITIVGARALRGCEHVISPDMIEAGTFLVAVAATKGDAVLVGVEMDDLDIVLNLIHSIGIETSLDGGKLRVSSGKNLRSFSLQTLPYPGMATDLQAPFAVLATQAEGMSLIQDPMYEGRLAHIPWLVKMGANAVICDPHRVVISGPTPLHGYEIKALDIRSGATMVIAGLVAEGETIVHDAEILDRGYEKLAERLTALGADIRRE
jgi:UDP-N-acetylglucosamine 1-carboxyvinyltransferase